MKASILFMTLPTAAIAAVVRNDPSQTWTAETLPIASDAPQPLVVKKQLLERIRNSLRFISEQTPRTHHGWASKFSSGVVAHEKEISQSPLQQAPGTSEPMDSPWWDGCPFSPDPLPGRLHVVS
ncbi:hypothetical protein MGG_17355 [Pyricularia oryzae 70-15]|uniref:Uncharacterized protein n=3 Tax=Pyricularia oryzae TaxID=318829 RepID=G4NDZ1_PYRO7|nr:uncharacterized protein MGG_17355 [Pyricularia oryzae 70-15]EHA48526.1 hypothetical protein MGG_17355 [Pyricularia oryzae 70-15]ELQ43839.1 hypothetical protein OOU_Y34scaffold00126g42 [Pyricularia oryzae Y34]KAI7923650.1 hypothetical protein M9X92_004260 [Pyricularia oryzae]KAI7925182.1 hypothetical protein M0657_004348 [Pyricularia oryzae]